MKDVNKVSMDVDNLFGNLKNSSSLLLFSIVFSVNKVHADISETVDGTTQEQEHRKKNGRSVIKALFNK